MCSLVKKWTIFVFTATLLLVQFQRSDSSTAVKGLSRNKRGQDSLVSVSRPTNDEEKTIKDSERTGRGLLSGGTLINLDTLLSDEVQNDNGGAALLSSSLIDGNFEEQTIDDSEKTGRGLLSGGTLINLGVTLNDEVQND